MIIPRKNMTVLGGDSHFNKWVVPLIPIANLPKVDVATHTAIFADQEEVGMEEMDPSESLPAAPEVILAKNQMVPFPQDWVGLCVVFRFPLSTYVSFIVSTWSHDRRFATLEVYKFCFARLGDSLNYDNPSRLHKLRPTRQPARGASPTGGRRTRGPQSPRSSISIRIASSK